MTDPGTVSIKRMVSNGHASPDGFWYDQHENEWLLPLDGEVKIEFADGEQVRLMRSDALTLPAHTRHRVTFTSRPALLAMFY